MQSDSWGNILRKQVCMSKKNEPLYALPHYKTQNRTKRLEPQWGLQLQHMEESKKTGWHFSLALEEGYKKEK